MNSLRILLPLLLCAVGCYRANFREQDRQFPRSRLRIVEPLESVVALTPATQPATAPTTTRASQPAPPTMELSIAEVRRLTLQNNLDLKVELLGPTVAEQNIGIEEARFESLFRTNLDLTRTDMPTGTIPAGTGSRMFQIRPGYDVPLTTGGNISLDLPLDRQESDSGLSPLNPSYGSASAVSLAQPLLRGAGSDINTARIRIAYNQYQQSQARAKLAVIRVLAEAERVYWRLYAARQVLEVRKLQHDLAQAQLQRARRQAAVGQVAEVEVVRAESGVADTLEAIIVAENNLRDRQRELKQILNIPGLEIGGPTVLLPGTDPAPILYALDAHELSERALEHRMELLETELQIAREQLEVKLARNDLLPLLSLGYTYNASGLGASAGDSFSVLRDLDFEDHRGGFQFELPIGNHAAKRRFRQALARRLQSLATKEQRVEQIRQEVHAAVDRLEAAWQRILAARQRAVLAGRVAEIEARQFDQGLRTSTDVLEAQTNLADAQAAEAAALADYQIAQVDLAFATGTLLGASKVDWTPTPVE